MAKCSGLRTQYEAHGPSLHPVTLLFAVPQHVKP